MRLLLERARRGFRAWLETPPSARLAFARAYGILLLCRLRLSFPRALGGVALLRDEWWPARPARRTVPPSEAELVRVFGRAVGSHLLALPCLVRAVALRRFLRSHGIESQVRLGMKRTDRGLEGHAWVERNGIALGDEELLVRSFVPFQRVA